MNEINLDRGLFNAVYLRLLNKVYSYMVLYGGSGSGKSTFIGQLLAVQMTVLPGRNLACLRVQKTDCLKSCYGEIYHWLRKFKLLRYWQIIKSPQVVLKNKINGNQIIFEGVDDIEDIKSIKFVNEVGEGEGNLTDVWYEEVNAEKDVEVIRELDRRLRDPKIKCRLILTFNPVLRSHWLFEYVTKELKMSGVDSFVMKTTYKDNKFLPADYGPKLERYKYTDPYAYQVYCLGEWGTSGQSVFDRVKIHNRLVELEGKYNAKPYLVGRFDFAVNSLGFVDEDNQDQPITFVGDRSGSIRMFEDVQDRVPYVVAVDTAGEGSDYYAAHVVNNITGEQVAVFHSDENPDRCVEQVYCLCCYYNHALYCPEVNFDSYPLKYFTGLDYPNIYRRTVAADKGRDTNTDRYGYKTGPENRQLMLSEMVQFTGNNMHLINDTFLLNEMLVFTRQDKKLKGIWWGAEAGEYDDLVMSYAIMLQARSQQYMEYIVDPKRLKGHYMLEELEDMLEEGKIDRWAMQEYIRTHDLYMSDQEERLTLSGKGRVSRYAR